MKKLVLSFGAISLAATLAGCTLATTRDLMTGNFAPIVERSQNGTLDYATTSMSEDWALCQALGKTRRFAQFDKCAAALDQKVAAENGALLYMMDGALGNEFYAIGATAEGMINIMKAEVALARSDDEAAERYAARIVEVTTTYDYPHDRRWLDDNSEAYLPRGQGDESWYSSVQRRNHLAEGLGTIGLIAARKGDANAARTYAAQIAAIDSSGMNATQWRLPDTKALWIGRIYMTLGDYEEAYTGMTSIQRSGLFDVVSAVDNVISLMNPIYVIQYAEMTGGLDMEAWYFVRDFEPKFLRYRAALETGRLDEARAGYDEILNEPRIVGFGTVHWQALHGRARIALADGDPAAAARYLEQAIQVIESQRQSIDTDARKVGFVGDKQEVYGDLVSLLVQNGQSEAAFEYAERGKARALIDMLAGRTDFSSGTPSPQTESLLMRLDALEQQSLRLASNDSAQAKLRKAEVATLRADLQQSDPALASLVTAPDVSVARIQAMLTPDETLLEYFGFGETLYAFIVTQSNITAVELDGTDLTFAMEVLRIEVQDPSSTDYLSALTEMYDRLIRPLEAALTTDALTIVPHGPLHYLPFAALSDGQSFMIDRWRMRLLPSASVLEVLPSASQASQDLLALGNPDLNNPGMDLPGTEKESVSISQEWPGARVLLRDLASESNFKSFAPTFRYLHLASHGEFNTREPLQSRMLLAPGNGEDGNLTVDELYGMRLNADLVTLSACETGLGDVQQGDDVIGLTRGFLFAGSRSVVNSLWLVADDQTAFLMETFYGALKMKPRDQALRAAMLATKERYPHPVFWAPFNLTGGR